MDKFITDNYKNIMDMARRICKGNKEWEDVAHYVIHYFLEKENAQELVDREEAMKYMSGMLHLSFYSKTSPYHKLYRQSGKVHELYETTASTLESPDKYSIEKDQLTEEIYGILLDMKAENLELWYSATLFEMYVDIGNYSEISRKTQIPRTSVSHGVEEARQYIKETLKNRGLDYDY